MIYVCQFIGGPAGDFERVIEGLWPRVHSGEDRYHLKELHEPGGIGSSVYEFVPAEQPRRS